MTTVLQTMKAVVTTGNGGYEKLVYGDVPVPRPDAGEVLLRVLAAGLNNTDINTRIGWYSPTIHASTSGLAGSHKPADPRQVFEGWNGATPFPLIQGTDCCGTVAMLGAGVKEAQLGKRVLVRPCIRPDGFATRRTVWMASDFNGAFAQFVKVPASEVFPVNCPWTDAELATIPCSYGTAENMLHRAGVQAGDHVLITGASGGVGSAAVQLAKRRGARVTAITSANKFEFARQVGADAVIARDADVLSRMKGDDVDVVVDNVAGSNFRFMLKLLRRGGTYVSSGAIAGPDVSFDMRDFYLKDLVLIGCTAWDEPVFPAIISYIEKGEIRPLVARTFALQDIVEAQQEFLQKNHFGNLVLLPPQPDDAP